MLAAMEPMLSAASFSPKASSTASSQGSNAPDPRLNGLDPKLLQGLDAKTLQSLGLDPNLVANILNPKSSSLPPRSSPSSFSQNYPRLTPSKPSATATSTLTNSQSKTSSAASLLGSSLWHRSQSFGWIRSKVFARTWSKTSWLWSNVVGGQTKTWLSPFSKAISIFWW